MVEYSIQSDYSWEDNVYIQIYANEQKFEYENVDYLNPRASKRKLLHEISKSRVISPDMVVILDNILDLKRIIVMLEEKKAIFVTLHTSIEVTGISEILINALKTNN